MRTIVWWAGAVMVAFGGVMGAVGINHVHRINVGTYSVLAIMNILLSVSYLAHLYIKNKDP